MQIKNRIKISFLTIILLVLVMAIVSITVTFQIRKNSFLNNQISKIILLQEVMNQSIQNIEHKTSINHIDNLKKQFNKYETSFEKIKKNIPLDKNYNFLNSLVQEEKKINEDLKQLFINEHKIEETFSKIYPLQEQYIKLQHKFDKLYPLEKIQRTTIYKYIIKTTNLKVIQYFGLVQYYSKETLYQHKDKKSLSKWIDAINKTYLNTKETTLKNDLNIYKNTSLKIGQNAIDINDIVNKKRYLQENIKNVLKENKLLATDISNMIENISKKITNQLFFALITLTILIIAALIIFSLKVSKNVGLSVDEIEGKVQIGLKQIIALNKEIESTQKEVIFTMGTIAEHRSKETGNHVKRVAEYSNILALHYGLDKNEAELLKQASPMHDIGKVAIPDSVLNKPGKFNEEERKIMDTHAFLGYAMLKNSERPLLKTAAIVAHQHHEKWDGSGYPRGLSGENIHIYGRITALADVFDALGSDRVYKKAWDNEKIFKLFKEEKGKHFDPKLVDIFFDNLDEFLKVQSILKDV